MYHTVLFKIENSVHMKLNVSVIFINSNCTCEFI